MRRLAALVLALLTGCFSASDANVDGGAGDARADGVAVDVDGATTTDGGIAPPGVCLAATELCGLESSLATQEDGWTISSNAMCSVRFADSTLIFEAGDPTCDAGSACFLATPRRPMGTARVVARAVDFVGRAGGLLTFAIALDPQNYLRLQFLEAGTGAAISVKGGTVRSSSPFVYDDSTWYSIRVTSRAEAVFEMWDGAQWVEVGQGPSPFTPGAMVQIQLGMTCLTATDGALEAVWGEVGGKE